MEQLLQYFIFLPLIGFLLSFTFANKQEKIISGIAYTSIGVFLAGIVCFTAFWLLKGMPILHQKHFV